MATVRLAVFGYFDALPRTQGVSDSLSRRTKLRLHRLSRWTWLMGDRFSQAGSGSWCLLKLSLSSALTGQTLVVRWSSSDDVLHCVSERTGVPLHAFYLTLNGKCLTEEALRAVDRFSLSHSFGHAWPATWRFFFGARRLGVQSLPHWWVLADEIALFSSWSSSSFGTPGRPVLAFPRRESHHPGRAPKPKPALVNPTFREPRVIHPKRGGTPPASSAPSPATTASQLDPTAIVTLLRSLGAYGRSVVSSQGSFPASPCSISEERACGCCSCVSRSDYCQKSCGTVGEICYSSSFAAANVSGESGQEIG